jgi:hypothetical protein
VDKIDWGSFQVQDCARYADFYVKELKWVKGFDDLCKQYLALSALIDHIYKNKEKVLDSIIDKVEGLKDYMLIHSVFDREDNDDSDWLVSYMIEKLNYDFTPAKQQIPKEVLDKLEPFNPREIDFFKEDVVITYGMWKKGPSGRLLDPICISHWNDIQERKIDMAPIIESYIPLGYDEDDLPF